MTRVEAEVAETVRPKADQKEKEAAAEKLKDLSYAVNDFQVQITRAHNRQHAIDRARARTFARTHGTLARKRTDAQMINAQGSTV